MNANEMTPSQVDEQIAELSHKLFSARNMLNWYSSDKARNSFQREQKIEEYEIEVAALENEIFPFEAEYATRRWNRAFLVTNANGHIHSSMHCSTCFPSTQYGWLPELSGKTEAEIIEHAGMQACTVCYPDAPVAKMTLAERQAVSKAEVQARKDAKAEAKRVKELAKVPRAHTAALKVDELINRYGWDYETCRSDFYAGTGAFAIKSMETAYYTYADIIRKSR